MWTGRPPPTLSDSVTCPFPLDSGQHFVVVLLLLLSSVLSPFEDENDDEISFFAPHFARNSVRREDS